MKLWVDYFWIAKEYTERDVGFQFWLDGYNYHVDFVTKEVERISPRSFEAWLGITWDKRFILEVDVDQITYDNIVAVAPVELYL